MAKARRTELEYEPDYEIDYDQVEEDREEAELSSEEGIPFWKPKEGRNQIRVLPPSKGLKAPYYKVFLHYGLGRVPLTCPGRKTCPICQKVKESGKGRNHPLFGTRRIFFNVLDREDEDAGIQVFSSGNTFFKTFLAHLSDPDWGDVTHPIEGFDVVIERTGEGLNTEYPSIRFRRNPSPLAEDQDELDDLLDERIDLRAIAMQVSEDRLEEAVEIWIRKHGEEEEEEDEDKPRRRRKSKAEPEEEEEEDKEEEEEEDKPKRKPRTRPSRTPKKEEEEEESEDKELEDLLKEMEKE